MFPNLSYLLHYLIGTAPDNGFSIVQTFGLLLAVSFLVAAYFFKKELKRKADEGILKPTVVEVKASRDFNWTDSIINGVILGVLLTKIVQVLMNMEAFQKDATSLLISLDGPWLVLLITLAAFVFYQYNKWKKGENPISEGKTTLVYPHDRIGDITVVAAISGILGSKLFSVIEDMDAFLKDPFGSFFSGSGLNIYGGLILGFLGVYLYLRRHKIPLIHVMDAGAPALILAYGTGRIGCQMSGDGDWGIVNNAPLPDWWFLPDWMWSYDYPHNVIDEGVPIANCVWKHCMHLPVGVYPTPMYEAIFAGIIFAILWALRKKIHAPGVLFFIYMVLNGIERFWIEKIRINDKYDILGMKLTQAEFIAILYVIIGTACCLYFWNRYKKNPKVVMSED